MDKELPVGCSVLVAGAGVGVIVGVIVGHITITSDDYGLRDYEIAADAVIGAFVGAVVAVLVGLVVWGIVGLFRRRSRRHTPAA